MTAAAALLPVLVAGLAAAAAAFDPNAGGDPTALGCPPLLFSQYYEDGYDKFLEIFNYGDSSVDLAAAPVLVAEWRNSNRVGFLSDAVPTDELPLAGTINPKSPFVIARSNANFAISNPDFTTSLNFNGDDSIALFVFDGPERIICDLIWVTGSVGADASFVRRASITSIAYDFQSNFGRDWVRFELENIASAGIESSLRLGVHRIWPDTVDTSDSCSLNALGDTNCFTGAPSPGPEGCFCDAACEASGDCCLDYVSICTIAVAPTAYSTAESTNEDEDVIGTFSFAAGTNPTPSIVIVSEGTLSSAVILLSEYRFQYVPRPDASGVDTVRFRVYDAANDISSQESTVTVTIAAVPDPPTALPGTFTPDEDEQDFTASMTTLVSDPDTSLQDITIEIVSPPANAASFQISGFDITYTPTPDFYGDDPFTFRARDDDGLVSDEQVATLAVAEINDRPVAFAASEAIVGDRVLAIQLRGDDVDDGDSFTYEIVNQPSLAAEDLTGSSLSGLYFYTPPSPVVTQPESDSFTFRVTDSRGLSSTVATVDITVFPSNNPPVIVPSAFPLVEDGSVTDSVDVSDANLDPVIVSIVSLGVGTMTITDPSTGDFTYTPPENFFGTDLFDIVASDGKEVSDPVTIRFDVSSENDAPLAEDGVFDVEELSIIDAAFPASDPDHSSGLLYSVTPGVGSVSVFESTGEFSYVVPAIADAGTTDSFTYVVEDPEGARSATRTITFNIQPFNVAPVASDVNIDMDEDDSASGALAVTDDNGDDLACEVVVLPTLGSVELATGTNNFAFDYTPAPDATGSDRFTYRCSDGKVFSNTGSVLAEIRAFNDPPVVGPMSFPLLEDTVLTGALEATDPDVGDIVTFVCDVAGLRGQFLLIDSNQGTFRFVPALDANGETEISCVANDGTEDSAPFPVTFVIEPVNDVPVAESAVLEVTEDTPYSTALNATDPDTDDFIEYLVVVQPLLGTLDINEDDGSYVYTPNPDVFGTDFFAFRVSDGRLFSEIQNVRIDILPDNDAPVAESSTIALDEDDLSLNVLLGSDVDLDDISYLIQEQPTSGTVEINIANGAFVYRPNPDFHGEDVFRFLVIDGSLVTSEVATMTVVVAPVNDAPVANGDEVTTSENNDVDFVLSGDDVDGDQISFELVAQPEVGVVELLNATSGAARYRPEKNGRGTYELRYAAIDENNVASEEAVVEIVVTKAVFDCGTSSSLYDREIDVLYVCDGFIDCANMRDEEDCGSGILSSYLGITAVTLFFLSGAFVLFGIIVRYRQRAVIRLASPVFCLLIVLGAILAYAAVMLPSWILSAYFGASSSVACLVSPWLLGLAFVLSFGSLLAKTWRVTKIFRASDKLKRVFVSDREVLGVVGILVAIEVTLLLMWTLSTAPKYAPATLEDGSTHLSCEYSGLYVIIMLLGFNCLMLIWGVVLAYNGRNLPDKIQEKRGLFFSIYNSTAVAIIAVPVLYSVSDEPVVAYFLFSTAILFIATSTLVALFGGTVIALFKKGEEEDGIGLSSMANSSPVGSRKLADSLS